MQDIGDVEGVRRLGRRLRTVEEVKKMGGLIQIRSHLGKREPLPGAVKIRGDHADLGRDAHGAAMVGALAALFRAESAVVEAQHGNRGPDHVHWICADRSGLDEADHALRKFPLASKLRFQFVQFGAIRQYPVPEKINDLFVGRFAGKLVDIVTSVDKNPFVPQHIAQAGRVGDDSFKSFRNYWHRQNWSLPTL